MNKIKYLGLFLLSGLMFISCNDLLDVNEDPNSSTKVTPEEALPVVVFYAAQSNYDHAEYGVYLSQALTTAGRSQTGSLAYKSGWEFLTMNRHPQWRRHFYDIGTNVNELIKSAEDKKAYNYILIARTIRLMSTLFTTDAFGDMPLSEAYTSVSPKYDTQQDVYNWMYTEADELLRLYDDPNWTNAGTNIVITKRNDRIYAGDLKKWKQFTYALKARIYLRKLPNWENTQANCKIIIDAVDAALADWTEPNYNYDGGLNEKNCPWGPAQPVVNSWESRKNELDKAIPTRYFLRNILGLYDVAQFGRLSADPRLDKLMKRRAGPAGTSDTSVKYRYLESNIGMGSSYKELNYPNLYYSDNQSVDEAGVFTSNTSYISLMLTEELLLIKAEAQYWAGQVSDAHETTVEAARINLKRHNVAEARITRYLSEADYLPAAGFNIGHLMRQKYVCMYLQAEMWTDIRRYKYSNSDNQIKYDGVTIYPGLRRPYNLYEPYWSGNIDWVQRINYDPETEEKYNKAELERLRAYRNPEWLKKQMIWAQ